MGPAPQARANRPYVVTRPSGIESAASTTRSLNVFMLVTFFIDFLIISVVLFTLSRHRKRKLFDGNIKIGIANWFVDSNNTAVGYEPSLSVK